MKLGWAMLVNLFGSLPCNKHTTQHIWACKTEAGQRVPGKQSGLGVCLSAHDRSHDDYASCKYSVSTGSQVL